MSRRPNKRILTALACAAGGAVGYGAYKYYAVSEFTHKKIIDETLLI